MPAPQPRAATPLLPVLFVAGIFVVLFPTLMNLAQLALHAKWQSADAEITDARINSRYRSSGGYTWSVQFLCKYSVQGREVNSAVEPLGLGSTISDRDRVLRFAREYPRGSHHSIRYNPLSPYEAMWSPDFDTFLHLWVLWKLTLGVAIALAALFAFSKFRTQPTS